MRTTIDKAGRIVIPRELREQAGLVPGPVDIHLVGNTIQIEVPESEVELVRDEYGYLVIAAQEGEPMTVDELRELRFLLQDPTRGRGELGD